MFTELGVGCHSFIYSFIHSVPPGLDPTHGGHGATKADLEEAASPGSRPAPERGGAVDTCLLSFLCLPPPWSSHSCTQRST